MIKIVQANLQHSKVASANLLQALNQRVMDVALVQEPYQLKGKVLGMGSAYNIYYTKGLKKIRSCIISRKSLDVVFMPSLSNEDNTTVKWHYQLMDGNPRTVLLSSVYLPYEDTDPASQGLRRICEEDTNSEKLIGMDANSHNLLWASTNTNERGKRLLEYFCSTNLLLLNRGNTPTFVTKTRKEVLDLTLATPRLSSEVSKWRVADTASLSDHCWLPPCLTTVGYLWKL